MRRGGHARAIQTKDIFLGDIRQQRVLDLGGGDSLWSLSFYNKDAEVVVIDIDGELLRHFKSEHKNKDIHLIIANAEKLPFRDECFDVVHASGCLHHLPHIQQGIEESHRVLKKGGKFFASDPNFFNLPAAIARNLFFKGHLVPSERRLNPFSLRKAISKYYTSSSVKTFYPLFSYLVPYLEGKNLFTRRYLKFKLPTFFKAALDFIDEIIERLPVTSNLGALIYTYGWK